MCDKVPYQSQGHAISGAIGASRKTGKGMRPYKCHQCPKWHLTSKPKGVFSSDSDRTAGYPVVDSEGNLE